MDFITIELIFGVVKNVNNVMNISSKIREFLKLSESLKGKINKLINSELNAAIDLLKQAENSGEELQGFYLQNSLIHFTKAKQLEKGERLIFVYLGLASSQYFLKDISNTILTLKQFAALDAEEFVTFDEILNEAKFVNMLAKDVINIVKDQITSTFLPHKPIQKFMKTVNSLFDSQIHKEIKVVKKKIEELNKLSEKQISFYQLLEKIELKEKIILLSREKNISMDKFEELDNYYYSKVFNFLKLQRKAIEIAEKLSKSPNVLKLDLI